MLTDKAKDTRPVKSSELRIGNILKDSNGKEYAVSGHGIYSLTVIENGDLCANNFMPIPLSEEWLLKLGFEKSGSTYSKRELYFNMAVSNNNVIWKFTHTYPRQREIYFVHQLQNLYFALAGEELTFKK